MSLIDQLKTCYTCQCMIDYHIDSLNNAIILPCECLISYFRRCALRQLQRLDKPYDTPITCPKCNEQWCYIEKYLMDRSILAKQKENELINSAIDYFHNQKMNCNTRSAIHNIYNRFKEMGYCKFTSNIPRDLSGVRLH